MTGDGLTAGRDQNRDQSGGEALRHNDSRRAARPKAATMTAADLNQLLGGRAAWSDGCLLWLGWRNPDGYGVVTVAGRQLRVHRLVCTVFHGPPPNGNRSHACHACDRPNCLAPLHVRLGDAASNLAEARERGRWPKPKPFCVRGHPRYGPGADVRVNRWGQRECRACDRIRKRQRRQRQWAIT